MTYKTGSIGEFMKWTKRVITDPAAATDTPKRWFDSDETAARSLGTSASAEAMVKLLSEENLALLHLIATAGRTLCARSRSLLTARNPTSRERSKSFTKRELWRLRKG